MDGRGRQYLDRRMKVNQTFGRIIRVILLAVFCLAVWTATPRAEEPVSYSLANGLKVILIENHRAPVVSMLVWIKAGSASEGPGEHGLAHLIEHMLFKGTGRRGPGQVAREVESSGGHINAYTSFDQTVYYIDMASRFTARGLDVLSDMVFHPSFDPEEFAREKEVVLEEIRLGRDNPDRKVSRALFAEAYRVHPYGRPIIGFMEGVRGFTREDAARFHSRWYRPDNMILVVSGDFDPAGIRPLIGEGFGRVASAGVPKDERPPEPPQAGARFEVIRADVSMARLSIGFPIPAFKNPDTRTLDLLAEILGRGRTSRLFRQVKRNKELVHSIGAGAYTPKDPGLFVISAQLDAGKMTAALAAITEQVTALGKNPVRAEELDRARLGVQVAFVHSRMTMSGEARTAANFEVLEGDVHGKDRYLAALEKLTPEDLKKAAARYLRPERMIVAVMIPQGAADPPDEKTLAAAVARGAAAGRPESSAKTYTLDNGVRLVVKPDSSLPLVSIRAAFLAGLRSEKPADNGISNFTAEVWDRSTTSLTAEELARAVENMAAGIGSFSGRNSFGLEAEFMSRRLDRGLELFTDVLLNPAFDPLEMEKVRPNILAAIKQRQDRMPARTFRLFARTMYQGHPYGMDTLGPPENVRRFAAEDLRAFYRQRARPENAVITVVGDVAPDDIRDRLARLLASWRGKSASPPQPAPPESWTGVRLAQDPVDREQAHFVLGFPAPGMESPDRYALEVLDAVLSGQAGRLFVEMRDKRSLAYNVTSFYSPGLGTGAFGLYIACEPMKYGQARAGFLDIIEEVRTAPVSGRELAGAKEYILGSYEIGRQRYDAQAAEATFDLLYGLGLDYPERYTAGIAAVTADDVLRVARKYLNPERSVEVVVGPVKAAAE